MCFHTTKLHFQLPFKGNIFSPCSSMTFCQKGSGSHYKDRQILYSEEKGMVATSVKMLNLLPDQGFTRHRHQNYLVRFRKISWFRLIYTPFHNINHILKASSSFLPCGLRQRYSTKARTCLSNIVNVCGSENLIGKMYPWKKSAFNNINS